MGKLTGKTAVITGGAGDIGGATAALFAAEGAQVLLVDRDRQGLEEAVAALGDNASWVEADVTQPEQVQHYVHTAVERYGGIDVFVNNAGIEGVVQPIPDYPLEVFDQVMAVNVRGAWLGLKYAIPAMQPSGGSIIITSSVSGIEGARGLSAYVTSKHAVIGLMRTAALECAALGIRVNSVNPAPIETRMMQALEEGLTPGKAARAREAITAGIPLRRYGTPEEVARMMLFLGGDDSRYCTGGVYMVDGGVSAR
jgi:NAD(P)-dependent dehydrogenase (short-subunit alcohol dehydrogenase family)